MVIMNRKEAGTAPTLLNDQHNVNRRYNGQNMAASNCDGRPPSSNKSKHF
jgi:hypothetical protein